MTSIDVDAADHAAGWVCRVVVRDGSGASRHEVRVRREDLERYGSESEDAASLVRRSFEFLLEREPKESILRSFDLPLIEQYFPEYGEQFRRRV